MEIDFERFGARLFQVVLLLVGLNIFNPAILIIIPMMDLGEWLIPFVTYSYWIGNILFGVIIYRLSRETQAVAAPIGLLSIMLPVFGGLFYLLTLTVNRTDK